MTEAELIAMAKERGGLVGASLVETMAKLPPIEYTTQIIAKAQSHTPGKMNKTEAAYAAQLDLLRINGSVSGWHFEGVKLRLADRTWYCPDFMVILKDGSLEFHEVKGFMRDDAAVKLKVAAEMFPIFGFYLVKKVKGGWRVTKVG